MMRLRHLLCVFCLPIGVGLLNGCAHPATPSKPQFPSGERYEDLAELTRTELEEYVTFYKRRARVLEREKAERIREIQHLRSGISEFTEAVRESFEKSQPEMKAYLGGELCERESVDRRGGILLIDRQNKPQPGTIFTGARALVKGPGTYTFYLLRQMVGNEDRAMAAAASQILTATGPGVQDWVFFEPLVVQAGDLIGLYADLRVNVPYDNVGTGDVISVETSKPKVQHSSFSLSSYAGRETRAYSFGAVGYLKLF